MSERNEFYQETCPEAYQFSSVYRVPRELKKLVNDTKFP